MIDRPFTEGQDVRLDTGEVCRVEKIGLRSTHLYFYRNHEYIVAPNKDMENTRIVNLNFPDTKYRIHVPVGVAYGSPVETVKRLLLEVADGHPEIYTDEEAQSRVFFDEFGDSALLFRLAVYVTSAAERFRIASELRDAIDEAFREHGITIAFPQRTVWLNEVDQRADQADPGPGQGGQGTPSPDQDEPDTQG